MDPSTALWTLNIVFLGSKVSMYDERYGRTLRIFVVWLPQDCTRIAPADV